jgi:hypothetical protein
MEVGVVVLLTQVEQPVPVEQVEVELVVLQPMV